MADLRENACALLSTTTVALDASAITDLYTVPVGKRCILSHAILVLGADAVTTDIQIGSDDTGTDDFVAVTDLGLINAQYDACILQPIPAANVLLSKSYAAGTIIQAEVTNHAGGATNTLYLFGMIY